MGPTYFKAGYTGVDKATWTTLFLQPSDIGFHCTQIDDKQHLPDIGIDLYNAA